MKQSLILFVILYIILIEFNAMRNFVYADAFVCGMHCCKLFVAHFDGAEAQAVICNLFVVAAVCAACHKIGDNSRIGVTFVRHFLR